MRGDAAGSPRPPVPKAPATFDLPELAAGNGDGTIFFVQGLPPGSGWLSDFPVPFLGPKVIQARFR